MPVEHVTKSVTKQAHCLDHHFSVHLGLNSHCILVQNCLSGSPCAINVKCCCIAFLENTHDLIQMPLLCIVLQTLVLGEVVAELCIQFCMLVSSWFCFRLAVLNSWSASLEVQVCFPKSKSQGHKGIPTFLSLGFFCAFVLGHRVALSGLQLQKSFPLSILSLLMLPQIAAVSRVCDAAYSCFELSSGLEINMHHSPDSSPCVVMFQHFWTNRLNVQSVSWLVFAHHAFRWVSSPAAGPCVAICCLCCPL